MNECSILEDLLFLLFLGGLGALFYFIIHNVEKSSNKQLESKDNKKAYDIKAHIGSKVCVEREVKAERPNNCNYYEYEYRAELGIIVGKREDISYGGYKKEFWLVQFEDGKVEEYDYYNVYTEYSEELVKAKESEK